jgi:hypothetical protein
VLRVWLIVMFAGAGGIFVGSLASTRLLGINQDAPIAPPSRAAGPLFASKQAHEWLEKSITRGYWVNPAVPGFRNDYVSLRGKERNSMKPSVAMATSGGRTPPRGRVQL